RLDLLPASRAGQLQPPLSIPVRDHSLGDEVDPLLIRELAIALRVAGAREQRAQIPESEARVVGVTRDPSGVALTLDHRHRGDTEIPELDRRRETRWTAPHDYRPVSGRH